MLLELFVEVFADSNVLEHALEFRCVFKATRLLNMTNQTVLDTMAYAVNRNYKNIQKHNDTTRAWMSVGFVN